MATEALKSTPVTNSDASPVVRNTAGLGGLAKLATADGSVTATTAMTAGSTYQMIRVMSNAKVKHLFAKLDAAVVTFTGDVGFYYSTGTNDGTLAANAGTKVGTGQEFGAAVAFAAQTTFVDLCNNVTAAKMDKEAWDLAGKATDPGGMFDIVITTTATTSGAPVVYMAAELATP